MPTPSQLLFPNLIIIKMLFGRFFSPLASFREENVQLVRPAKVFKSKKSGNFYPRFSPA
jgi:hypothetical protein